MFVHRRDVQIQWGDCDPANIVYYPRYFEMFDDSTSIMFEAAGFSKQDIVNCFNPRRLDHDRKPGREHQAFEL
jgi:acyl-CoA thioesterase FadM